MQVAIFSLKEEKEKIEARRNVFASMQKEKESFANMISVLKGRFYASGHGAECSETRLCI